METTEQGSKHWHGNVMCFEVECDPMYIFAHAPRSDWYDKPEEIQTAEPDTMEVSHLIHPENSLKTMAATTKEPEVFDLFVDDDDIQHTWQFEDNSPLAMTCTCGFVPETQAEIVKHTRKTVAGSVDVPDIPGENGTYRKLIPTYDVNPIEEGGDSSGIVHHTSMVQAIRDMVGIMTGEALFGQGYVYGWHIQYNDGTPNDFFAQKEFPIPEPKEDE